MASEPAPFAEPYPGFSEENKGPLILTVTSVLTSVAFVFVSARIYSRMISVGKLAADDYIVTDHLYCMVFPVFRCIDPNSYPAALHMLRHPRCRGHHQI